MQVAITASERGHKITLAEKSGVLGGILNFTDYDVYKVDLRGFKNVLIRKIETKGIEVLLNTDVTPELKKTSCLML
jgi:NADPH-dependent 2,4-dienoyl-CoA reductase/sulfur reductase-like enzyme